MIWVASFRNLETRGKIRDGLHSAHSTENNLDSRLGIWILSIWLSVSHGTPVSPAAASELRH